MLTILHTADWHLALSFPGFDAAAQRVLTRARLQTVRTIFDVAEREACDAVVCAGDLFDVPNPSEQWWSALRELLCVQPAHRPIVLLPGNHDPLLAGSVYAAGHPFRAGLPRHVHVVDADDFTLKLGENAVIHAIPCRARASSEPLWQRLPSRGEHASDVIRLGVLHGQSFDLKGHQTNFPIAGHAAHDRGFDYLAIGDTHRFRNVAPAGMAPVVYPSAPEPTKFGERDAGFVACVRLFSPREPAQIERLPVASLRWELHDVTSLAQLGALVQRCDLGNVVLRVQLRLTVTAEDHVRVRTLLAQLRGTEVAPGLAAALDLDDTALIIRPDAWSQAFTHASPFVHGVASRLMERLQRGEVAAGAALEYLHRLTRERHVS